MQLANVRHSDQEGEAAYDRCSTIVTSDMAHDLLIAENQRLRDQIDAIISTDDEEFERLYAVIRK